tara:strand:- start:1852 stop:2520 length:669 start_codon:yes stop_codon:yes gene_type:complete
LTQTAYPLIVIDNFFEDPDAVVDIANNTEFFAGEVGNYPGQRSKPIQEVDPRLFQWIGKRVYTIFQTQEPEYWELQITFQKIKSFAPDDQYNPFNGGWIHTDSKPWFGGVIYLDKNPEPDTGTSIYKLKRGYTYQYREELHVKQDFYLGKDIDTEEYNQCFKDMTDMYEETVKVHNVYNRLILFDGNAHHGAQTYGTKERLTMNFFGTEMQGPKPPLLRGEC